MYTVRPPVFLKLFYRNAKWCLPREKPTVYLTFDDGPIPEITPWVLDTLKKHNIKATFFCVGENVEKNNLIYHQIKENGHRIGNHTHHHLNGWKTNNAQYYSDIEKCNTLIKTNLFRPPYGKMSIAQNSEIAKNYQVIMWDIISGDFDPHTTPKKCLENIVMNVRNGSIIVFHDNIKAKENLYSALPRSIEYLQEKGYSFDVL